MDIHQFHSALGQAIAALDRAGGAEERAKVAERALLAKQNELNALADAHAKLKADSDAHLAANLARMNEETEKHNALVAQLKREAFAHEQRNKDQTENASAALTALNAQVGIVKKDLDDMLIQREKMKNDAIEYANRMKGE
jgi:hypothetical protein